MRIGAQKDSIGAPNDLRPAAPCFPARMPGHRHARGRSGRVHRLRQEVQPRQPAVHGWCLATAAASATSPPPYDFCCFAAAEHEGGAFSPGLRTPTSKKSVKRGSPPSDASRQTQQLLAKEADTSIDEIYADQLEGTMVKADTTRSLPTKLGFEGEREKAFIAEVDRYNGFFDAQSDDDFGKEAYRLSALRTAPFYGVWYGGSIPTTVDGLRINEDIEVPTPTPTPSRGLLRGGRLLGSIFANNYPEHRGLRLRPHHHLRAMRRAPHRRRHSVTTKIPTDSSSIAPVSTAGDQRAGNGGFPAQRRLPDMSAAAPREKRKRCRRTSRIRKRNPRKQAQAPSTGGDGRFAAPRMYDAGRIPFFRR